MNDVKSIMTRTEGRMEPGSRSYALRLVHDPQTKWNILGEVRVGVICANQASHPNPFFEHL